METALRFGCDRALHPAPKFRCRSKPFSGCLNTAFHLHARKSICRAQGAAMHMSIKRAHVLRRKLTIEVGVEFFLPRITRHGSSPLQSRLILLAPVVAGDLATSFSHAINVTSPFPWGWKAFPQSPDTTSLPPHREGGFPGNSPAVRRSRSAAARGSSA